MDKVEKRFNELIESDHEELKNLHLISDGIMYDHGYLSCVGVIIFGEKYAGILHSITGDDKEVEPLVEVLRIEEFNLEAVIISGADNYADNMKNKMIQMHIPVIDSYEDHYMIKATFNKYNCQITGECSKKPKEILNNAPYWSKEIIVNPQTREVLLWSGRSGYLQLSPKII